MPVSKKLRSRSPGIPSTPDVFEPSLSNAQIVHRHSGSATASVRIDHAAGKTRVEVSDAGKGISNFDSKKKVPKRVGVGIQGMQERVRQFHGDFEIRSAASGTSVVVTLPN
jgi:signal transduction histidine kinase